MSTCKFCKAEVYWVAFDKNGEKHVCESKRQSFRACKYCGSLDLSYKIQVFSNETEHISVDCNDCGKFLGYAPQVSEFINQIEG